MKKFLYLCLVIFSFACDNDSSSIQPRAENCSDALDNDLDGWIDCWDPDCQEDENCKQGQDLCGNGIKEEGEACDMHDFAGETCLDHGYSAGELYCSSHCSISLSACTICGNGYCEQGEDIENCPFDCDHSQEAVCGNLLIEYGEECDSSNLAGQTCQSLNAGYSGGILRCGANCIYDYSACEYCGNQLCEATETAMNCPIDCSLGQDICGNGLCEVNETETNCPADCAANQYYCGDGICSAWEDASTCAADCGTTAVCGNQQIDGVELCDSLNLNGQSCVTRGHDGGALACNANCTFDESACWDCGDGICNSNNGESEYNCGADCAGSCFSGDVYVLGPSSLQIYGTTAACGNHPYTWGPFDDLSGDEILFNADNQGDWLIWWAGSSCSASTLHWNLTLLTIEKGTNGVCWAICGSSGANLCCSYSGSFPALCGNGTEERIQVLTDQNL